MALVAENKVQRICVQLRELAYEKGPDAKLPSMRDLCSLLETSRVTLGEALEVLEGQNILYRRHGSGIYVSPKLHRKTICVLLYSRLFLSPEASPFWGLLWGFLAQEAQKRAEFKNEYCSFHLVLNHSHQDVTLPEEIVQMVQDNRVHGILTIGVDEATYNWLTEKGIPNVAFAGPGTVIVGNDHEERVRLALGALVAQGCRHLRMWKPIDFLLPEDQAMLPDADEIDFRKLMQDYGLDIDPELVQFWRPEPGYKEKRPPLSQDQGYQLAMDTFGNPNQPRPDGLFITDDLITVGAMIALQRLGVRVGVDVKIVSHANAGSQALYGYTNLLTLIEFDPAALARTMFDALELLFQGQMPANTDTMIKPRLKMHQ